MALDIEPTNSFQRTATTTGDADVMTVLYNFFNTDATLWQIKTTTPTGSSTAFTVESQGAETCEFNVRLSTGTIYVALAAGGGITNPTSPSGGTNVKEFEFVQSTTSSHDSFHMHEWDDAVSFMQVFPAAAGGTTYPEGVHMGKIFWPLLGTDDGDGMSGYAIALGNPETGGGTDDWFTASASTKTEALVDDVGDTWRTVEVHDTSPTDGTSAALSVGTSRVQPIPYIIKDRVTERPIGVLKYVYAYYQGRSAGEVFADTTNLKELVIIAAGTGANFYALHPIEYGFDPTV